MSTEIDHRSIRACGRVAVRVVKGYKVDNLPALNTG